MALYRKMWNKRAYAICICVCTVNIRVFCRSHSLSLCALCSTRVRFHLWKQFNSKNNHNQVHHFYMMRQSNSPYLLKLFRFYYHCFFYLTRLFFAFFLSFLYFCMVYGYIFTEMVFLQWLVSKLKLFQIKTTSSKSIASKSKISEAIGEEKPIRKWIEWFYKYKNWDFPCTVHTAPQCTSTKNRMCHAPKLLSTFDI